MEITGDSGEYEYITKGMELSKDAEGLCLEIGLRRGLGTKYIIDGIVDYAPHKIAMAIDPYGSIIYEGREGQRCRLDYTNEMMQDCQINLQQYAKDKGVLYLFWALEDMEFFERFGDGVPVYQDFKRLETKYSFVHLDATHTVEAVSKEILFFSPRMDSKAVICIDDVTIDFMDIVPIEAVLFKEGFELIQKGLKKALYQKI